MEMLWFPVSSKGTWVLLAYCLKRKSVTGIGYFPHFPSGCLHDRHGGKSEAWDRQDRVYLEVGDKYRRGEKGEKAFFGDLKVRAYEVILNRAAF